LEKTRPASAVGVQRTRVSSSDREDTERVLRTGLGKKKKKKKKKKKEKKKKKKNTRKREQISKVGSIHSKWVEGGKKKLFCLMHAGKKKKASAVSARAKIFLEGE